MGSLAARFVRQERPEQDRGSVPRIGPGGELVGPRSRRTDGRPIGALDHTAAVQAGIVRGVAEAGQRLVKWPWGRFLRQIVDPAIRPDEEAGGGCLIVGLRSE